MKSIHLVSGIFMLVFFALTGQYMDHVLGLPEAQFDAQRMMYRASHIYLLWAGLLNTCLGIYWRPMMGRSRPVQLLASWLLVLGQPVLIFAFFIEPDTLDRDRLLTFVGCVLALTGTGLTILAGILSKMSNKA